MGRFTLQSFTILLNWWKRFKEQDYGHPTIDKIEINSLMVKEGYTYMVWTMDFLTFAETRMITHYLQNSVVS